MNSQRPPPSLAWASTAVPDSGRSPDPIPSRALFGDHQAVEIEHAGQRYLLRITRENKLILTK
ncbi:MAG: hemin uptake protein HemP [Betaproteobacteria bacterium]|jgi:hemin uptake protein HemP|nr:hemin uptake protein HemP [Betaproteobacteria bacterium]MBK8917525.1 hemin uptake protein HemP [Betaproteobacteria bacterium]